MSPLTKRLHCLTDRFPRSISLGPLYYLAPYSRLVVRIYIQELQSMLDNLIQQKKECEDEKAELAANRDDLESEKKRLVQS